MQDLAIKTLGDDHASALSIETRQQVVLKAAALRFAAIAGQLLQKALHQSGEGGVEIGSTHPGTAVRGFIHRNCDVLHFLTVPYPAPRSRHRGSDGRSTHGGAGPASAAVISWGPATNISGDSDVDSCWWPQAAG